jgi:hypothetical protein
MPEWETDRRRREAGRTPGVKGTTGSVQIGGVGEIKVNGGNLEE